MSIEFSAFIWKNDISTCVWCSLRKQGSELALPCSHSITNETKINYCDVHPRFLRIYKIIYKIGSPLTIEIHDPTKSKFKYSDIMAQISPFATNAKNTDVAEAF